VGVVVGKVGEILWVDTWFKLFIRELEIFYIIFISQLIKIIL
jgi:hypothetical protein